MRIICALLLIFSFGIQAGPGSSGSDEPRPMPGRGQGNPPVLMARPAGLGAATYDVVVNRLPMTIAQRNILLQRLQAIVAQPQQGRAARDAAIAAEVAALGGQNPGVAAAIQAAVNMDHPLAGN